MTEEQRADFITALDALRAKRAPRVREQARIASQALAALALEETEMDEEAEALCPGYQEKLRDYKLTFMIAYPFQLEEYEGELATTLEQASDMINALEKEASAATAAAAVDE